jgi:hypothetical protein
MPRRRAVSTMERDAKALDLFYRGHTYRQIADALGWASPSRSHDAVRRALADTYRLSGEAALRVEEERYDQLVRAFNDALTMEHYVTGASGNVALHPVTGEPLADTAPVIQAGLALLKVSAERRKMRGWDAPARHEVRHIDEIDARLIDLAESVGRVGQPDPA